MTRVVPVKQPTVRLAATLITAAAKHGIPTLSVWQRAVLAAVFDHRDPYELTYWCLGYNSMPKGQSHGRAVSSALRGLERRGFLVYDRKWTPTTKAREFFL